MSAYSEIATTFTDPELLVLALTAMGYKHLKVNIGNPQPLVGFQGDYRTLDGNKHTHDIALAMKAEIILTRQEIGGMSNDVGFARNADGIYQAIISDYDSTRHNATWLHRVKFNYAEQNIFRAAKKQGLRPLQTGKKLANGNLEYKFLKA